MNRLWRRVFLSLSSKQNLNQQITIRTKSNVITTCNYSFLNKYNLTSCDRNFVREKSTKKQSEDTDDDNVIYDDDSSLSKDSKVVKFNTTSMRTDMILKSSLGIARNKIEQMFYESRVRLNGKKVLKKSVSVKLGDELDLVKEISPKNSDHLIVARVEILNVTANEDSITVTTRRFKRLLIENYKDPYKASSSS